MNWTILLIIFVVLVTLDKGITYANIKAVQKNFPQANALSIEKNPLARWAFGKFGLLGGTLFQGVISLATLFIAYKLLSSFLSDSITLYIIIIVYGLVIMNNTFFFLKYMKVVP